MDFPRTRTSRSRSSSSPSTARVSSSPQAVNRSLSAGAPPGSAKRRLIEPTETGQVVTGTTLSLPGGHEAEPACVVAMDLDPVSIGEIGPCLHADFLPGKLPYPLECFPHDVDFPGGLLFGADMQPVAPAADSRKGAGRRLPGGGSVDDIHEGRQVEVTPSLAKTNPDSLSRKDAGDKDRLSVQKPKAVSAGNELFYEDLWILRIQGKKWASTMAHRQ